MQIDTIEEFWNCTLLAKLITIFSIVITFVYAYGLGIAKISIPQQF